MTPRRHVFQIADGSRQRREPKPWPAPELQAWVLLCGGWLSPLTVADTIPQLSSVHPPTSMGVQGAVL